MHGMSNLIVVLMSIAISGSWRLNPGVKGFCEVHESDWYVFLRIITRRRRHIQREY